MPPIVNPQGVVLDADPQDGEIDAQNIGSGPIIDISAPNSVIHAVKFLNAPEQAILVRTGGLHVIDIRISDCDEGLHVVDGIKNVVIEGSAFEKNRIGVWLAPTSSGISLLNNRFSGHMDAAVWAVQVAFSYTSQNSGFTLTNNLFESDRMSLVLANTSAIIESNDFVNSREAALFLIGDGAVVRGNRIRNSRGIGIFADGTQGTLIEANEIDHNKTIGVLIRSSRNDLVLNNRMYSNGYGIAFVLGLLRNPSFATDNTLVSQQFDGIVVIGDSPVIRGNHVVQSKMAGLNILDFVPHRGSRVSSNPFLASNALEGNKWNEPTHGEYRIRESED